MLRYVKRNQDRTFFERPADMPEPLHQLLMERGIATAEAAEAFLNPGPDSLIAPDRLSDMAGAADRVQAAIRAGKHICVYGDYDVDGVCASAILKLYLDSLGAQAEVYLPSRHTEGYGLNENALRDIAQRAGLLVTVDCGVTSVALAALAKSLGLEMIVTDHHRPIEAETASEGDIALGRVREGFLLPDCPVVNPLLNAYPFPHLCGAGVAWKLVWALSGGIPMQWVDIAALATVADVVPLTGENRAIVAMGLEAMNRAPRPGVAALIEAAGLNDKPVTASAVAFQLGPRLNAGGRLDTAMRPFELVTAPDLAAARPLAEALNAENTQRRTVEQRILREAEARLRDFDFVRHRAIILAGEDWNPGVIGLAASRLVEKYHYPTILLSNQGDRMTGSCRSIEGVDIHAALTGCAAHLLKFGGHSQAAGLTLASGALEGFIEAMDAWLWANVPPSAYIPTALYDAEIEFDDVTPALIAALEGLQPTGFGNSAPVFRTRAEVIEARAVGAEGAHLKLTLSQGNRRLDGIAFRMGARAAALSEASGPVDALFAPKLNTYMGRVSVQMEMRALEACDAQARIGAKLERETSLQCDFLTQMFYNKKILPSEGGALPEVSMDRLEAWMDESPQGTLVLAGDLACASRLLRRLPEETDLFFGALPEDPRAFNAVCVLPCRGAILPGYRRLVLAGVPREWLEGRSTGDCEACEACEANETREAWQLAEQPGWTRLLPDIDAMRQAWRALAELSQRPLRFHSLAQLAHLTAEAAGLETFGALASILAIVDMGLFDIDPDMDPPRLRRLNLRRAEPEASGVWRALQRWKTGEV